MTPATESLATGSQTWTVLREQATAAMEQAYAPYSGFRVGAALLCADGVVVTGCNVENASFPAGICAERAAVAAGVTHGCREFTALVIVTEAATPTPPCGICRQVLVEFAPRLAVLSATRAGEESQWSLTELLPQAFTPTSLGRR